MRYIRLSFKYDSVDAVVFLGPFSAYWATLWLDVIRQDRRIFGLELGSFTGRIVAEAPA